jgi:hypothetical protein
MNIVSRSCATWTMTFGDTNWMIFAVTSRPALTAGRTWRQHALSHLLHRSRPLYSAPATLRSRVSAAVIQHSESPAQIGFQQGALQKLQRDLVDPIRRVLSVRVVALVVLLLGFLFAFVPSVVRQVRAASYVETAVAAHRSYLDGDRTLELRSSSPELVTVWFADKVSLPFRLPNAQSTPNNTPAYRLTGAGLVNYRGNKAALVAYEKEGGKISLLVASSKAAPVARRIASVVVAPRCRTWPIVPPSTLWIRMHHQMPGLNT